MRRIRIGPHELNPSECDIVDDMSTLRALAEIGAPRQLVPSKGRLLWYARKVDVQAARTLLSLTEDERLERHEEHIGRSHSDD
jgi:hypothetical protein